MTLTIQAIDEWKPSTASSKTDQQQRIERSLSNQGLSNSFMTSPNKLQAKTVRCSSAQRILAMERPRLRTHTASGFENKSTESRWYVISFCTSSHNHTIPIVMQSHCRYHSLTPYQSLVWCIIIPQSHTTSIVTIIITYQTLPQSHTVLSIITIFTS